MHVQVGNLLPAVPTRVDQQAITTFRDALLAGNFGSNAKESPQSRLIFRRYIVDRGDFLVGDNQDVKGRLRVDIFEGRHQFVLINNVGGDFAFDDFAENTFAGHNTSY